MLDERPDDILKFAGRFFDRAELKEVVEAGMEKNNEEEKRNEKLNHLLQGKKMDKE